jgi:hypothetical protein
MLQNNKCEQQNPSSTTTEIDMVHGMEEREDNHTLQAYHILSITLYG